MYDKAKKSRVTRRGFLEAGSAALAAAGILSVENLAAQQQSDYKPRSDRSKSDPGPTNPAIDAANPDSNYPLSSDAGGVQTFKYPFSFAHKRLHEGGWSREVTQRELAVSKAVWPRSLASAKRLSPTCPRKNSSSFKPKCRARSRKIAALPGESLVPHPLILLFAPCSFRPPSATRAGRFASSTQTPSKYPRPPRRSSPSSRVAFATCTGIQTPTNGNTSTPARDV